MKRKKKTMKKEDHSQIVDVYPSILKWVRAHFSIFCSCIFIFVRIFSLSFSRSYLLSSISGDLHGLIVALCDKDQDDDNNNEFSPNRNIKWGKMFLFECFASCLHVFISIKMIKTTRAREWKEPAPQSEWVIQWNRESVSENNNVGVKRIRLNLLWKWEE